MHRARAPMQPSGSSFSPERWKRRGDSGALAPSKITVTTDSEAAERLPRGQMKQLRLFLRGADGC